MLSIKDIVDLAKAGYKPADVKELIELSNNEASIKPSDNPDNAGAADIKSSKPTDAELNIVSPIFDDSTAAPAVPETKEDETDYKALYEKTKIELDQAQKTNIRKDYSSADDNKTDEEIVLDIYKNFI